MNDKIYSKIINITSQSKLEKELRIIDRIYDKETRLIVDNDIYYFEDRKGNLIEFNTEDEFIEHFKNHKGTKRLYKKLLLDEKELIKCCIELCNNNLEEALVTYKYDSDNYESEDVIIEEIIKTRLYPQAYCEYIVYIIDYNILKQNYKLSDIFSYNEEHKIQGIYALGNIVDAIWRKYIPNNTGGTEDYLWIIAHKKMIEELLNMRL